jgi:hypothetical protein
MREKSYFKSLKLQLPFFPFGIDGQQDFAAGVIKRRFSWLNFIFFPDCEDLEA